MSVLILAEYDNKTFTPDFLRVLNAAREFDRDIHVLIVGKQCDHLVAYASDMLEVQKVIVAKDDLLANLAPEYVSSIVSEMATNYSHIICSASNFGKAVFPRVAAQLDIEMQSAVNKIFSPNTFGRSIFAGRVATKVRVDEDIKLLLINAASFVPVEPNKVCESAWPEVADYQFEARPGQRVAELISRKRTEKDTISLQDAQVVLGAGRGLVNCADDLVLVDRLAGSIGAAVGATRAVVDAGWLPSDRQIGQTAKSVSPSLYLAFGISGATQHLAGMKNSQTIVAVNRDPEAPIFEIADFSLIADLKDVMPELCELLSTGSRCTQTVVPEQTQLLVSTC